MAGTYVVKCPECESSTVITGPGGSCNSCGSVITEEVFNKMMVERAEKRREVNRRSDESRWERE